ncbi:MAG: hypothetical protein ABW215_23305 [Kibdelosporangium sp.]
MRAAGRQRRVLQRRLLQRRVRGGRYVRAGLRADPGPDRRDLADVGATGSPAVLLAVDDGWRSGRITTGDTVPLLAIEASRYVYTGLSMRWNRPAL